MGTGHDVDVMWQVEDLQRALHAEPGSAEALRLASLRAGDVSAAMRASPPTATATATPASAPHHHTFDAVMQHHALRAQATVNSRGLMHALYALAIRVQNTMHYAHNELTVTTPQSFRSGVANPFSADHVLSC